MKKQFHIANEMSEVSRLCVAAEEFMQGAGVAASGVYNAILALEEMLTNIVKYGHADAAHHEIQVCINTRGAAVDLRIEDDGRPFNPLAAAAPDTSLPLEERGIGGLGIHLVRNLAAGMEYRRENDHNITDITIGAPA